MYIYLFHLRISQQYIFPSSGTATVVVALSKALGPHIKIVGQFVQINFLTASLMDIFFMISIVTVKARELKL